MRQGTQVAKLIRRHVYAIRVHWQTTFQGVPRHGREASVQVHGTEVVQRRAIIEVRIREAIDVDDPRIRDIHVPEVERAHVIPREEWLAPSQRAPAKSEADTKTNPEAYAKSRAIP
jgi:predicted secreted Zn-dependent protease